MFYNQDQGNPRFDVGRNAAGRTRNDDNPDFPAETWLNGAAGLVGSVANILTPQAFSNKFDRRTPYSMQWLFNVQRELANNLTLRGRLSRVDQPPSGVVSRRQRGGAGTGHRCQPLSLSELRPARAGRKRRQRQLQLAGHQADQALLERRDRAGLLHLVEVHRYDQRHPHLRQRHAVLAGRPLHAVRPRAFGLRQSPSAGHLGTLRSAVRQGAEVRRSATACSMPWSAAGSWAASPPGDPDSRSIRRPASNRANTNINVRSSGRHRPERQPRSLRPRTAGSTPAAFALQPIYQFGNAARNSVPGPARLHARFQRAQELPSRKEGHELQFRWEAYNVLNHPVWGFPNTNFSSANFGRITSTAANMRQMQFALKYVF